MGSVVGAAAGGSLFGKNPITKALGIDGGQGEYADIDTQNLALEQLNKRNALYERGGQRVLQNYGLGQGSISDALKNSELVNLDQDALIDAMATDPLTGSKFATEQVQNNPILGQLFGKGGALERANTEEQQLAGRGYQLQPEDHEAWGQVSGDITRMYQNQENDLASALADRGLASAPSGAATMGYSGLMGNKHEQLAKAQTNIAQQRMQNNLQRLAQTRNYMTQLGGQGAEAIDQQYARQSQGVENKRANLQNTSLNTTRHQAMANEARMQQMQDKRSAKGGTLAEAFGSGLMSSAANVGAAPGKFVSSAAGSSGKAYGNPAGAGNQ